jgi:hypothetical protein
MRFSLSRRRDLSRLSVEKVDPCRYLDVVVSGVVFWLLLLLKSMAGKSSSSSRSKSSSWSRIDPVIDAIRSPWWSRSSVDCWCWLSSVCLLLLLLLWEERRPVGVG